MEMVDTSVKLSFFALIALPLIIALIIAIIYAISKGKKSSIGVIVAVIVCLLLGLLAFFPRYHIRRSLIRETIRETSVFQKTILQNQFNDLPPVWLPEIEEQFTADLYLSIPSAAKALGKQILPIISEVVPGKKSPSIIQVCANVRRDEIDISVLNALADKLREENSSARVLVETIVPSDPIEKTDSNAVTVQLEQPRITGSSTRTHNNVQISYRGGTLIAKISGSAGRLTRTVEFMEKSWLSKPADFLNSSASANTIIARSQDSCTTQQQAYQQALDDACQKANLMFNRLPKSAFVTSSPADYRITTSDILNNSMIIDRFVQTFQGSAAPIYRQALLIDVSPDKINQLLQKKNMQMGLVRTNWLYQVVSIIALVILITVLYFFLNAATKGYYSTALLVAALVFVIVGVFLIYFFYSFRTLT